MNFLKKNLKFIIVCTLIILSFNVYFIFLIPVLRFYYLYYLDFLIGLLLGLFIIYEYWKDTKKQKEKAYLLDSPDLVYRECQNMENIDILEHDISILEKQLHEQFDMNCDMQDFFTKWCHEVKIPLAACLLMNEKIEDNVLKNDIKEQLEKMKILLNACLVGCKVQSSIYDIQIKSVNLMDCVKTSIKNNQFFLIRNHFEISLDIDCSICVYSDKDWLVYVLDQLLSNAVKYACCQPKLTISASMDTHRQVSLCVEDNGEGIKKEDIRHIFEKGYTGHNHHNGQYKSTGMGLYISHLIMKKLGHQMTVESREGEYSRFIISFQDNRDFFHL